jgi:hypothetical protein
MDLDAQYRALVSDIGLSELPGELAFDGVILNGRRDLATEVGAKRSAQGNGHVEAGITTPSRSLASNPQIRAIGIVLAGQRLSSLCLEG